MEKIKRITTMNKLIDKNKSYVFDPLNKEVRSYLMRYKKPVSAQLSETKDPGVLKYSQVCFLFPEENPVAYIFINGTERHSITITTR
ncbi:MAG: hypothetical protein ACI83D_000547 [Planctomycetota bacterium]|jgi:hypothetical protein